MSTELDSGSEVQILREQDQDCVLSWILGGSEVKMREQNHVY